MDGKSQELFGKLGSIPPGRWDDPAYFYSNFFSLFMDYFRLFVLATEKIHIN